MPCLFKRTRPPHHVRHRRDGKVHVRPDVLRDQGSITESRIQHHCTYHILVGTPGTMTDLIRRRVIDVSDVKVFVVDEAFEVDDVLDKDGLGDQTLRVKKCV